MTKTPEIVRKKMWTCLLAHKLIRRVMLPSAQEAGVSPRSLSFTAAMQSIAASWLLAVLSDDAPAAQRINAALANGAQHIVGNRPDRVEPRAVKRRPKEHALLTKPRVELLKEKSM